MAVGVSVGTAGCAGGEVLHSINRTLSVPPGGGVIEELPAEADKIKFIVKDDRPFDVYVFTDPDDIEYYRAYIEGESPSEKPAGDRSLGGRATRGSDGLYQVATKNKGRQSLGGSGPSHFVVDHSDYRRETVPGENAEPLSAMVDLEAVKSTLPF